MAAPTLSPPRSVPPSPGPAPEPAPRRPPRPLAEARAGQRLEVQALRAVAVGLVIAFHAAPQAVPGGFVGVDVFFAISGLLITSALLREVDRHGTVSLRDFWARRARRLLPAALLVLAVCTAAVLLLLPATRWEQFLVELRASVLYVENWQLAASSIDYFAAAEDPTPVQHYWSLSVEEQFYVLWPVLLLLAIGIARWLRVGRRRAVIGVVAAATAASFAYAVWRTSVDPVVAYFSTPARAWEFGVGALLALFGAHAGPRVPLWVRGVASWAGFTAIAFSAFAYSVFTPFPGVAAALPVLGAIAVMWAGLPRLMWAPTEVLVTAPIQRLGDWSYSAYLWHWPLLILLPTALGVSAGWETATAAVALTVVLAWLTMRFVENPVRFGPLSRRPVRWTFGLAALGMAALLLVAAGGEKVREDRVQSDLERTRATLAGKPRCFGAASRDPERPCRNPKLDRMVVPTPLEAKETKNAPCDVISRGRRLSVCRFGPADAGEPTVALLGDSHASAWRGAVDGVAEGRRFAGVSLTYTGCPFSVAPRNVPQPARRYCDEWRRETFAWLEGNPNITTVFVAALAGGSGVVAPPGRSPLLAAADGYAEAWRRLPANIRNIIVLRDNPKAGSGTDACVMRAMRAGRPAGPACAISRSAALDRDPAVVAGQRLGNRRVRIVDLTERFCDARRCYPVIGGALVHRDQDHINPVFSATLAPALQEALPPTLD